jgi:HAMP domain-containing protein
MDKDLAQQPFFKAFLTDPSKDKAIADFYDLYKTANEVSAEFNEYKKTGQYEAAKSLMENEDKAKLINASKPLRRIADSMTKINTQIAQIKINQDIAPDERLQRVNALEKQLSIVARQYKKVTETLDIQE